MAEKLIVIGGTAAGLSAASRARKEKPDMEIQVFEKSGFVSYGAVSYTHLDVYKRQVSALIPNISVHSIQKFFIDRLCFFDILFAHCIIKLLMKRKAF